MAPTVLLWSTISLFPPETYKDTFPDWEVVQLPEQSWKAVKPFQRLKMKNKGKWWVPVKKTMMNLQTMLSSGYMTGNIRRRDSL